MDKTFEDAKIVLNKGVESFEKDFNELLIAYTSVKGLITLTNGGIKKEGEKFPNMNADYFRDPNKAVAAFLDRLNRYRKKGKRLIWRDKPVFDCFENCLNCGFSHPNGFNPLLNEKTDCVWEPEMIYTIYCRFKVER
jgi:hypothetical protein